MNNKEERSRSNGRDMKTLADEALQLMAKLGYSHGRIKQCRRVWKSLVVFASEKNIGTLSENLFKQYMACFDAKMGMNKKPVNDSPRDVLTIVLMLIDYERYGCWRLRSDHSPKIPLPESLAGPLHEFLEWRDKQERFRPKTLKNQKHYLQAFLRFLNAKGIQSLEQFHPELLSSFFVSQSHLKPRTIQSIASDLRGFLRYLNENQIIPRDCSLCIPVIRIPMEQHLPKVWPQADVDALLAAVDRGSPKGKRDYAILLLACRLGMRASDIRNLRFENIKWDEARIVLNQVKTGATLTLPLMEEIGEAIIDYLRHGRPSTSHREVFLRNHAPLIPFQSSSALYEIVTRYRLQAGLSVLGREKRGIHSLRHTVACRLLEADTPFETISDILGHSSLDSTHIYAKVNISSLRSAPLDPEEVFSNA